jgi:hypothetical protein
MGTWLITRGWIYLGGLLFFKDLVSTREESWGYSWICPRIGDVCPVYITI